MTRTEEELLTRLVEAEEKQAEALQGINSYLSTVADTLKKQSVFD